MSWKIIGPDHNPTTIEALCAGYPALVAYDESGFKVAICDFYDPDLARALADTGYSDGASRRILFYAHEADSEQDAGERAVAEARWHNPAIREITYATISNKALPEGASESMSAEGVLGWTNGTVRLDDGREFCAGGGWLNADNTVTPYRYSEAGDVDELAAALGVEVEEVMSFLGQHCPRHHDL